MIIVGSMYTGGDGTRKRVTSVDGDTVHFEYAMSGAPGEIPVASFYEWLAQMGTGMPDPVPAPEAVNG